MKIGQAIDMIIEDNDLELEWGYYKLVYDDMTSTIRAIRKQNASPMEPFQINPLERQWLSVDWELMQKPISFMEAVKSEKLFRVEYGLVDAFRKYKKIDSFKDLGYCYLLEFLTYLEEEFTEESAREILICGEYYVMEED